MKLEFSKKSIKLALICIGVIYIFCTFTPAIIFGTVRTEKSEKTDSGILEVSSENPPNENKTDFPAPPDFLDEFVLQTNSNTLTESSNMALTDNDNIFKIYDKAADKILNVSAREFLPAAIATEMDLFAPREALKAQTVAIYTVYSRERNGVGLENGADFSCDTENWLIYTTVDAMKTRWGEDFEKYYDLLTEITDEVYGEVITQNNEPICAAYFAISCGSTEKISNVWEGNFEYLQAVASPGDVFTSGYLAHTEFSPDKIKEKLSAAFPSNKFNFSSKPSSWFTNSKKSNAGYTNTITVCGVEIDGTELRNALGLRSAAFDVSFSDDMFVFTTRGWGHGVGMSQAGAIFMAKRGAAYEEILSYYYPKTEITKP